MLTFIMLFFQVLTIVLGIHILSNDKLSLKLFVLMVLVGQGVGYPFYLKLGANGVFPVVFLFIIFLSFKTKRLSSSIITPLVVIILLVLSSYTIQLVSTYFSIKSLELLRVEQSFIVVMTVMISLLTILLCFLIRYILTKLQVYIAFNKHYSLLIASFVFITVIIFYMNILMGRQQGFTTENIRANSILFLFYTFLLFGVFIVLVRTASRNIQMENEKIQNQQLREYTEELEIQYEEIRKFRHDYINILSTMTEYLNQKDIEGLTEYYSEKIIPIGEKFQSNDYRLGALSNIKIQEVKGIVSNKLIKAQDLNIHTTVDIVEPIEYLHMDTMKLCRSLGIILDNAIEEARLCEEPVLEISFIEKKNLHLIILKNSCQDVPAIHQIYQKGFSTKGKNRGLGLSNLREILAECNGVTLDTYVEEGYFVQEIGIVY